MNLASKVSTYREQATRELSALSRQGLLRRDGWALLLHDVARLERVVAPMRSGA